MQLWLLKDSAIEREREREKKKKKKEKGVLFRVSSPGDKSEFS